MTIKNYINKVLKDNKQKPIPRNTNLIGNKYLKVAFAKFNPPITQF